MNEKKKIFLGGTCNGSDWRDRLIPLLEEAGIPYFNPVVADWTPECMAQEIHERETCGICLYVITPKMTGVYSIAEVADDSNKRPDKTVFAYLSSDDNVVFSTHQLKSLKQVRSLVEKNGAICVSNEHSTIDEIADCVIIHSRNFDYHGVA